MKELLLIAANTAVAFALGYLAAKYPTTTIPPLGRMWGRLFPREEINGNETCPTYLYRWRILRLFGCAVYLHKFVGDDWSMDLHDHPKRFISIGLRGGYTEHTSGKDREYRAPWVRTFPAEHTHRISGPTPAKPCWTLVVVLRASRPWGFYRGDQWIPWRKYIFSPMADENRSCP